MHLPDGFLDVPTLAGAGAVSLGVVAYSTKKVTRELSERSVPLLGVTAAFVFAAQMVNFPIAGGTSGHLVGAVLIAALLGPYASVVVLTVVLAAQALLLGDGGVSALGANVLNMAVIGGMGGYLVLSGLKRLLPKSVTGYFLSLAVASWAGIVLAAVACSLELAASGTVPGRVAIPAMTSIHMVVGLGEALITVSVVAAVLAARPDLVRTYSLPRSLLRPAYEPAAIAARARRGRRIRVWALVAGAIVVTLALGVIIAPFASRSPDGLDKTVAIARAGASAARSGAIAPALVGGAAAIVLFALVFVLGRILGRRVPPVSGRPRPAGNSTE
jgi:cobalt/nickel transport system permease protein